jgi:hypothetical protein
MGDGRGARPVGLGCYKATSHPGNAPLRKTYLYTMSPEAIKQDFESALVKHFSFKARLRSFLHGNSKEEGPLRDPDQCGLGQWINERRQGTYSHLPELRDFDAQHRLIHLQANRLMDLHVSGHREEALAGFGEVQVLADTMVTLLQTMEAKLRTAQA